MPASLAHVCIVDAYSSGSLYAAELRRRGFASVHVQSADPIPHDDLPSFIPDDHVANIIFDGDLDRCLARLAPFEPRCVIAGSEQAVLLADQLSERLGLATNGTALSEARRNKFAMQQAIAAAGLPSIPTRMSASWDEVEPWASQHLPVVVKPPSSSGTDHVFICKTLVEAEAAFHSIVGKLNTFGEMNPQALVQRMIEGTEYIVNHVSCDGRHYVTDIWRVDKVRGERPVYDRGVALPSRGDPQDQMVAYVAGVLDAIGIRVGASHAELMLTAAGPILIEVAARMHGQKVQLLCEQVMGFSQVSATLDAYLAPQQFFERAATPYEMNAHLQRVELLSPRAGTLRGLPRLDDVRALPSFHAIELYVGLGEHLPETVDLMTIPGYVDLIHADPKVVEQDHRQLRAWELDDFYDVATRI